MGQMDIEKEEALQQVQDSIEIVENARADQSLNPVESNALEIASLKLRNLERSIIAIVQLELVASLTADTQALKELTVQIKQASDKLSGVASVIEKAATVVESFIKVVTAAASSGWI